MASAGTKSPPLRELTGRQIQWILGGYAMTMATMPGQTVFIAQFNESLRGHFDLSHGEFGGLYTIATLLSATVLVWAGGLADKLAPRLLALLAVCGLALVCLTMSVQNHIVLLVLALAGLRFCGQGMLSHIAMTTMSRWFNRFRGRALSFAGFGFASGEAIFPFLVTLSIGLFGWRQVWAGTAVLLLAVIVPIIFFLLRDPPDGKRAKASGAINPDAATSTTPTGLKWTRGRVLRDPLFYSIIPGIMGPPAIGTLFIFHQAHLAELKGWELTVFTAFFPVLSVTGVAMGLAAGFLVDRFGAWRLMPVILLPMAVGCLSIGTIDAVWGIPLLLLLFGMTNGLMSPVMGALWAEIYGTAHIGAIRALAVAALVSASALGPGLAGYLVDIGVELELQAFFYAAYCIAGATAYLLLREAFKKRVEETSAEAEA
ncbi:MFS transporter [Devosia pacifica]|uniref:MFS transporter n=1 Tax=Devosia pacifica TaxID=1335967 RepID=A0A918S2V3_9HYPH|nr:MFS transporter [Devosia pacifica]GHA18124.1 MFS transporter [Devosia pacifica]